MNPWPLRNRSERRPSSSLSPSKVDGSNGLWIMGAVFVVLFTVWLCRHLEYRAQERLRSTFLQEVAVSLGVPPDIKPPSAQIQDLDSDVQKKASEIQTALSAKLPPFDEAAARKAVLAEWKTSVMAQPPTASLEEISIKMNKEIDRKVQEAIAASAKPFSEQEADAKIRKDASIPSPSPKPTRTKEEIKAEVDEKTEHSTNERYPPEGMDDSINTMLGGLAAYKLGDKLDIKLKSGKHVKGFLRERKGTLITIDKSKYQLNDISPNDAIRFDERQSAIKINEATAAAKSDYKKQKEKYRQDFSSKLYSKLYRKAGYYKISQDTWGNADEFIAAKIEEARKNWADSKNKETEVLRKSIEAKFDKSAFHISHGYRQMDGKWIPEKEAMDKLVDARRKKHEADLNAKRAQFAKEAREQAEQEVYTANGYIKWNNQWLSGKIVVDMLVNTKMADASVKKK